MTAPQFLITFGALIATFINGVWIGYHYGRKQGRHDVNW